jgi:PelA/Pel-15E family pectate lyase
VLSRDAAWYGTDDAARIATAVLALQHPRGGWAKNFDPVSVAATGARRGSGAKLADEIRMRRRPTTIDNGATYTEIRFLARVAQARDDARCRRAVLRGLDSLLAAQYAHGGWPQVYPLAEDYTRHVTFNDDAMIGAMALLRDVASARAPFAFVDDERRALAAAAIVRGLELILQLQVRVNGTPTVWAAQYDARTLEPVWARSYEPPALTSRESVSVLRYLMAIERPAPEVIAAIEAAVTWFEASALEGLRLEQIAAPELPGGVDRVLVEDPSAPPLWARFYAIGSNRSLYLGRDGVIRERLEQIEHERRVGYDWIGDFAGELLRVEVPAWRARLQNQR